jgi:hypothetical protein
MENFSEKEIEKICTTLFKCENEEELSLKIKDSIIEFTYRGQKQ